MIIYKSQAEIDLMREAGMILAETLARLQAMARPGLSLLELDKEADRFIRDRGCIPGFVGYQGYRHAICTSVNDQVVHGIPTNRKLREGDLLSLDAGLIHRGFWADADGHVFGSHGYSICLAVRPATSEPGICGSVCACR